MKENKADQTLKFGKEVVYSNGLEYVLRSNVTSQTQFEAYAMEGYIGSFSTLSAAIARIKEPSTNYDHNSTPGGI